MGGHAQTGDDLNSLPTDDELRRLQRTTVLYYLHETNPDNGLVRDKTHPDAPASIAAVGLTGPGRATAARRSPTGGTRRPGSSPTATTATTRDCSSTCWAWAHRRTRCRPKAMPRTAPPTNGRRFTAGSC